MRKIIVGSRRSKLALTQTNWVINQLKALGIPYEFEVKEIVTKGDKILDVTLSKVGGKGLFVKEIEQAMLDKEIDMAVHSMKDMPAVLPEGLTIGCIPPREDHRETALAGLQHPGQHLDLVHRVGAVDHLLGQRRRPGVRVVGRVDADRRAQEAAGQRDDRVGHGGGEQHGLPVLRQHRQDLLHVVQEAEVQHPVCLVQYQRADPVQPELARGVAKGVFHKNTAARKLSRLTKRLVALG